jgi:GNAT superfamily N-acetyltransferase
MSTSLVIAGLEFDAVLMSEEQATDREEGMLVLIVKPAISSDSIAIANLLEQLGYAIDSNELKIKIAEQTSLDGVFVAKLDGLVVGCISLHVLPLFHAKGNMGRITSLIVDESHRGKKIGILLATEAERWFKENKCIKIEVTSGRKRIEAHRFYEKLGYAEDGKRFSKNTK